MDVPSSFKNKVFSVYEISSILKEVLSSELFQNIQIQGEIKKVTSRNDNIYIELVDASNPTKASIRVNLFSYYAKSLTTRLVEGDLILIKGDISYYPPQGNLTFNAKYVTPFGEGEELLRIERLKQKLIKEGLIDPSRKRKLPAVIKKVGIVTSKDTAAYQDILKTLSNKVPVDTILFNCSVQGEKAPSSIIKALLKAYKSDVDVIILARGGGSKGDLNCFNDEQVCRILASSPKVTITGIGHEIDTSICDLVADINQITPTGAANCILPDLKDVKENINSKLDQLNVLINNIYNIKKMELFDKETTLYKYSPIVKINSKEKEIFKLESNLDSYYQTRISNLKTSIIELDHKLDLLNPLNNLKDGYAIIKKDNKLISSINQLNSNDEIEIGLKDGIIKARIENKEN